MEKKPYNIEARELGVVNFAAIKNLKRKGYKKPISVKDIKAVWNYREAGITVDTAREYIEKWQTQSYHHTTSAPTTGRFTTMQEIGNRNKITYREKLAELEKLADDGLSWSRTRIAWEVEGRKIITVRHEDVTWSDRKSYRYPESSTVSYTSHLLRTDEPGTIEAYKMNIYDIVEAATEKKISHDLRGNWKTRIAKEMLNVDYRPEEAPAIFFKKVAVCPAFPNMVFASVYDGSAYQIGKTRIDKAMKDHNGGLYCYKTAEEAKHAPFPSNSVLGNAEKRIISVQVRGKRIRYDNGKYAVSEMTPIAVVA